MSRPALDPTDSGGSFPGVKTEHLPRSDSEVKIAWSIPPFPQYVLMACYVAKNRGNFALRCLIVRISFISTA